MQGLLKKNTFKCLKMNCFSCFSEKNTYLSIGIVTGNSGRRDDNPLKET